MKSAKNIIDKIFLDFTYKTNGRDKTSTTDETRSFFYDNLLPKIDSLLTTRGATADIRIESLNIDLEKISLGDLPYKLLSELEAQLDRHAATVVQAADRMALRSNVVDDIDVLIYFLQTGSMPWHHDIAVHPEQLFTRANKANRTLLLDKLKQILNSSQTAQERFLLQFSDRQVEEVFNSLVELHKYESILRGWYQFANARKQPELLTGIFKFILHDRAFINDQGFIRAFAAEVVISYLDAGTSLLPEITGELQNLTSREKSTAKQSTASKDPAMFFKSLEKEYRRKVSTQKNKSITDSIADKEITEAKDAVQTKNEIETPNVVDQSYKVNNAGLVLLNPYLQMFFTELKLVKGETFVNKAAQHKAVQVLQYLSTGNLKTPEHLLALNKTICGVDMAMPVPARLRLTKEQKEACEVLLNAVIKNWPPLKNTSIEGFRQSFLHRNGVLKKDEKDWILHIEHKGIDILLEQLPWGFSIMKYPWNEYLIHVQW
jgi:hypothetical protein